VSSSSSYSSLSNSLTSAASTFPNYNNTSSNSSAVYSAPIYVERDKDIVRKCGKEIWVDNSLRDWPTNDCRLFIGDVGKEVTSRNYENLFVILIIPIKTMKILISTCMLKEYTTKRMYNKLNIEYKSIIKLYQRQKQV
jgi:hypothetical protein